MVFLGQFPRTSMKCFVTATKIFAIKPCAEASRKASALASYFKIDNESVMSADSLTYFASFVIANHAVSLSIQFFRFKTIRQSSA